MADMRVNFPAMQQAREDFTQAEQDNKTSEQNLVGALGGLSSAWSGDAATGFQRVMQEWQTQFQQVQRALNRLTTTLGDNLQGYQTNEQNQVQASSPITSALGAVPQAR